MNRIAVYLDEEEVTDQVSSLKKDYSLPLLPGEDEGLGLENATLRWNEVTDIKDKEKPKDNGSSSSPTQASESVQESNTVVDNMSDRSVSDVGDRVFELKDISILFPEGELTVVTGPTASGKTALLVSHVTFPACAFLLT